MTRVSEMKTGENQMHLHHNQGSSSNSNIKNKNKNNSNEKCNNFKVSHKSSTSFLNAKTSFDLLSTGVTTKIRAQARTTTSSTVKAEEITAATKLITTTTKIRPLLMPKTSSSSSSSQSSSQSSLVLTAMRRPTETTTTTTTKATHLKSAAGKSTATTNSTATTAFKSTAPPTTHVTQEEQQSNDNDCQHSTILSYAAPATNFSLSASPSSSPWLSSSSSVASSLCYAATLTAASTELLRCNIAKLASNFIATAGTLSSTDSYNRAYQRQSQQQQQQQHQLPQFVSFNSRKPKRKVFLHQQQQNQPQLYSHHLRRCSYHRSSLECFFVVAIFSLILLLTDRLQIVSATTGLLNKNEPMFISRSETFKFVSGDTIVLPCEVANTEPYIVAWRRGIAILFAGSVKVSPDPRLRLMNGFNLQIRDAVPQDAGDYICQIATMEPREITHSVEILVPPRIHHISTGGHLQVKKGSSVRIECSASGNPAPNVTWSRKNNILPNGEEKLHSHILSIENVDRHKGGVYICTANNGVGQPASSQVVLLVLYPPEISVERSVVFSGEGHEAMLVCIVHGETQPEVLWFKDTMQLDTTERHIMETRGSRHTLIIRKVHPQDFGNYSCVAENQLGKSRKTLQLSGKPNVAVFNSPPISQYKDRYNISWAVDSHTPIAEYKLSFRRMPQGHEVIDHPATSLSSSSSSSANLLQIYGGNNHNHRINFGGSDLHGGYSVGGGGGGVGGGGGNLLHWGRNDWHDVVLPAMPLSHHYTQRMSYMIRGLDPDQHYEATVQAKNRYGWSDLTHSFIFSTSSNDGLNDLSTFLNHGLSDNEMRDLSVTFYGSASDSRYSSSMLLTTTLTLLATSLHILHGVYIL